MATPTHFDERLVERREGARGDARVLRAVRDDGIVVERGGEVGHRRAVRERADARQRRVVPPVDEDEAIAAGNDMGIEHRCVDRRGGSAAKVALGEVAQIAIAPRFVPTRREAVGAPALQTRVSSIGKRAGAGDGVEVGLHRRSRECGRHHAPTGSGEPLPIHE